MAETNITGAFGSVKSEKGYLNARLDVQSARNKLFELNKKLTLALRDFNSPTGAGKNYQSAADAVKTAQAKVDAARIEVARVESLARAEYNRAKRKIDVKKEKSEAKKIDSEIERLQSNLQRAKDSGQPTDIITSQIEDAIAKKNKTGKYAPQQDTGNVVDQTKTDGTTARDYATEIANAGRFIFSKKGKDLQALSSLLKDANYYEGPITGTPNDALVVAYQQALQGNLTRTQNVGSEVALSDFLASKIQEVKELGGGVGGPSISESRSISTPLEAAARVEDIFKTELGRMPTPEEVAKYSKKLIAREEKQSSNVRTVTKKVGGVTVTETTGGLDRNQFLQELVRKMPEYSQRKSESRSLTVQTLQGTANDNGVTLSPQQLDQYALDVENGKDIKVIQNQIRSLAGLGMPDNVKKLLAEGTDLGTIYSPYKRAMATVLELNPDAISLNDPTLRSAIGPNGEATLYDFQRQLRKDSRWQYTNNAREEVSNAVLGVLRDFGLQG